MTRTSSGFFQRLTRLSASVLALAIGAALTTTPVRAQGAVQSAETVIRLDIAAGDLNSALVQLSRASGLSIVADPAILSGKTTRGLKGSYKVGAAMTALLDGQNLAYSRSGESIVIKPAAARIVRTSADADLMQVTASAPAEVPQDVVVTGFRSSLTKSLNSKKNAINVIDVISAEDIGKFPANNVAEALQRVPGISITRDRGEGLFVRVRGLGPNFQTTTVNGRSAAVNENVRDSGQSGRQFRFDTLASELVSGVEVIKSPLPSLEEGAIGGVINIRTFRPLDFKKPTLALSATASYKELADVTDPQYSGLVSWNNADRTLGALLSLNYNHRTLRQDRITGVGWAQSSGIDTNQDGVADSGALNVPTAVRPTFEREQRDRYGLTGALQWKPSAQTEVNLDLLYSYLRDQYDELTYSADFSLVARSLLSGSAVVRDGALVGGTTSGTQTQIGREVSDLEHKNFLLGINAVHRTGPWILSADISSGRAFSNTRNPITRTRILGATGTLTWSLPDAGDGVPSLKFLTADLNNPRVVPGRRIEWRVNYATDLDSAAQFDAVRSLDFGPFTQLSVGAKYHERSRDYKRRDVNLTRLLTGANYSATFFDASFYEAFPVSDFLGDVSGTLPTSWNVPSPSAFWNATNRSAIIDNSALTARALGDYRNSYYVSEKISAAYASTQIATSLFGGELRGEGGLRYAKTDQVSAGYATTATAALPVSYSKTYSDLLPSLNLLWKPMDKVQVHASAAKVITRPSLADLSPRLTLNSSGTVFTAVGGNPQLNPFKANQYDLTAEWYFAPGSALIAGAFRKDITTFVYNQNTTIQVDGQAYTLTAPVNGGDARVNGYELAYQHIFKDLPAPFDGLGMLANYTFTDSEATYTATLKDKMQNVAKNSYNLTAFYEKNALAARLSYSWVDDVLANVGTGGFAAINDKAFGTLDGSLSYNVNNVITLVAEGQNLTNQAQWQFVGRNLFGGYTNYGRTFSFSIRAKY